MSIKQTTISPAKGWQMINFRELKDYSDLLYFLTIRGIKVKYAQSVLGIGWAIIQPLMTTIIFTVVFGNVAKISSDGLPYILFSYLALWPWNYFSGMLQESSSALITNSGLITKVYFPRMILPLVAIFSKLLDFIIAFVVVVILLIYFDIQPGFGIIYLPVFLLQLALCSIGAGMILSAMAIQYRDVKYALAFITQLLMYAAPVIYSTKQVPPNYQFLYSLNPMVGVIEGFRSAFTGKTIHWEWIWPGMIVSVCLFVFGMFYFKKMETQFADVA